MTQEVQPGVVAVSKDGKHQFSKKPCDQITLLKGIGVEGDAHSGSTVQHRSRVARDPTQPNLRQVHLIHQELLDEARKQGFELASGDLGENLLTQGLDLLGLPRNALLHIGDQSVIRITGLRNPCAQINDFRKGLLTIAVGRDEDGRLVRKAGIMAVVTAGGIVRTGDTIEVELPALPHQRLEPV